MAKYWTNNLANPVTLLACSTCAISLCQDRDVYGPTNLWRFYSLAIAAIIFVTHDLFREIAIPPHHRPSIPCWWFIQKSWIGLCCDLDSFLFFSLSLYLEVVYSGKSWLKRVCVVEASSVSKQRNYRNLYLPTYLLPSLQKSAFCCQIGLVHIGTRTIERSLASQGLPSSIIVGAFAVRQD